LRIYKTVEAVNKAVGGNGVWIADRGFDGLNLYEMWFSLKCHFVVRQRGDRCVITTSGVRVIMSDLVEHLRQRKIQAGFSGDIIFTRVHLPDNSKPLYIVAMWSQGYEEPLILLTTLVVENFEQARHIIWYYRQRWAYEEVTRFLKSRVGFEQFRIRRYEAIQRLAVLAMFAMGFLTWILLRSRQLVNGLFYFTSRFRKQVRFAYYRLLDGLQEFARLLRLRLTKILPLLLENG
jgi:IS4 transposase